MWGIHAASRSIGGPVAAVAGVEGRGDTRWHRPNVGLVIGGHVGPALGGSAEEPFRAGFRASGARYTCGQPGSRSGTARLAATSLEGCPSASAPRPGTASRSAGEPQNDHWGPGGYARCMSYRFDLDDAAVRRVMDEAGRAAMDGAEAAAREARCPEHGQAPEIEERDPRTHEFSSPPHAARRASTKATKRSSGRFPDPAPTLSGRERTRSVDEALQPPKPRAEISRRRRRRFSPWVVIERAGQPPSRAEVYRGTSEDQARAGHSACLLRDVPSSSREATRLSWIPPFVG